MTTENIMQALDGIETNQREIKDRMLQLEQKSSARADDMQTKTASLGAAVAVQFEKNLQSFKAHKTLAMEIETKSVTAFVVGARSSISPTPGGDTAVSTQLMTKLLMRPAGGVASLVYPRRSVAILGGAAAVAENGLRPQSEPIYVSRTQELCTVAGHAVLSETALRTTGELENVINLHLVADVLRAADSLLIAGGVGFVGGLLSLATPDVIPLAGSNDMLEESIAISAMGMRAAGYQPNVVIVNPTDWRIVYLRRETGGMYVHSSPLAQTPLIISGCSVVFSTAVLTKQAVLIDTRFTDFMPLDRVRVEVAYVASQFLTGVCTVSCELQGLPVVRDLAAIRIVSRA